MPYNASVEVGAIASHPPKLNQNMEKDIVYIRIVPSPANRTKTAEEMIKLYDRYIALFEDNLSVSHPNIGLPIPLKIANKTINKATLFGDSPINSVPTLLVSPINISPIVVPIIKLKYSALKLFVRIMLEVLNSLIRLLTCLTDLYLNISDSEGYLNGNERSGIKIPKQIPKI